MIEAQERVAAKRGLRTTGEPIPSLYRGRRRANGDTVVTVNDAPLKHYVVHSPTGFEWGYGGSGPSDLALAILVHHLKVKPLGPRPGFRWSGDGWDRVFTLHQDFKWQFVARWPQEKDWVLWSDDIDDWMKATP